MKRHLKMKILIIEDNAIQALVLEKQLNKIGYSNTQKALSPDKAIESLHQFDPDLLLVDINLGNETSGIDLVNQTNSDNKRHVIFISGNSDKFNQMKAKECGAAGFLVKPIHFEELNQLISNLPQN